MKRRTTIITIAAVGALALIATGTAVVANQTGDDTESPITGDALRQASEAALAHTGGGTVTETEVGDEESLYEVEVTLSDGSQVDVQLDANFRVVGSEGDDENDTNDDDD